MRRSDALNFRRFIRLTFNAYALEADHLTLERGRGRVISGRQEFFFQQSGGQDIFFPFFPISFLLHLCCMQFFSSDKCLQEFFFCQSHNPPPPPRVKWSAPYFPYLYTLIRNIQVSRVKFCQSFVLWIATRYVRVTLISCFVFFLKFRRRSLVLGLSFRNTRLKDVILPSIFIRLDSLKWGYSNDSNCRGRMTYTLSLKLIYSTINKDDSRYEFNWNQLRSCSGVVNPLNPNIPNCDPPQVKTVIHPIQ